MIDVVSNLSIIATKYYMYTCTITVIAIGVEGVCRVAATCVTAICVQTVLSTKITTCSALIHIYIGP